MTQSERLAFRVQTDIDLLDMAKNEILKMQKFLKQEKTPLNPKRRQDLFRMLSSLQGSV